MTVASEQVTQSDKKDVQKTDTQEQGPGKKDNLRGMAFQEQEAALKPAGEQTTAPKPTTQQKQAEKEPAPKAPGKTRAQIMKENAGKMSSIEDLLTYGAFDWAITDSEAKKAMGLLDGMPEGEAAVVIQGLNAKNPDLMKRLNENITASARKMYPRAYLSVVGVSGNVAAIEAMIQGNPADYGVGPQLAGRQEIGWVMQKVSNALIKRMASFSVSSTPAVAAGFQQWLKYTPDPPLTGIQQLFTTAQDDQKTAWKAQSERKADEKALTEKFDKSDGADAKALRSTVKSIEELLSYSFTDWAITDGEARRVFGMLTNLGGEQLRYAVLKLDQGPFMDRLISNLPSKDRWANKKAFLTIMSARPPEKNVSYVKELLSYGVFDWAVTDEEARLAFYLVKTMPKDVRDQFKLGDGGKWWDRMEGNLDQDTKTAKDAHFYDNKEEVQKKKLEFQEGAEKWPKGQLKMSIEMLTRMGEEDWVEKELQQKFDKSEAHAWVFTEMGFAHAGGARDPKIWKEFKDRSAGEKFVDGMKAIGSGAKLIGQALGAGADALITGDTSLNVDLQDVQNVMGGDVAGLKFAKNKDGKEGENKLAIGLDRDKGIFTVNTPSLAIASIATMMDTTRVQTGPVNISNIDIKAKWPTPDDPEQYYILNIGSIDAKEIWQMGETSMTGIGGMSLQGLSIKAKAPKGGQPADKTQLLGQALTDIQESMTRLMGMIDTKDPAPEKIGMRVGQGFTGASDVKVDIGSLTISDVAQSAGGHVGEVKAEGISMAMTQKQKGDRARARIGELEAKEKKGEKLTTEEAAEKAEILQSLPKIVALEKREAELVQKREQSEEKDLDPHEKEELAAIRDQLTITSAEVGIKSLSVKDVDTAGMKAKSLELTDLKAKVEGERELGEGQGEIDVKDPAGNKKKLDSKVKVEVSAGSMKGAGLVMVGKNKLEAYEARIAELKTKIEAKEATEADRKLKAELEAEVGPVHKLIVRRDEIKLMPPGEQPKFAAELQDVSGKLAPWVGRAPDTSVDEMSVTGKEGKPAISGKVDVASGKLSIEMGDAEVKGVKSGDLELKSAKLSGVKAEADVGANLLSGADMSKTLQTAGAHVDHAELEGLKMGGTPLSVKLNQELEALQIKAKTYGDKMTEDEKKRLAELPALYTQAATDENALATLRQKQKDKPNEFTPEDEQQLKMLADKCDPTVTKVQKAEMNNLDLKLDTKQGKIEVGAGKEGGAPAMKVEGVEIGKLKPDGTIETKTKVDSAKLSTVKGQLKTEGGMGSLLDPMNAKEVGAEMSMSGLEIEGLENKGQTFSATLQGEADALATKAKGKTPLEDKDKKRLAELPALIKQAKTDEARLIELRRLQKIGGDKFTADMGFELKALAKRLDPSAMKVAKVEVGQVDTKVDTKAGKLEVNVGKGGNDAGLKVQGVELGKVGPDGQVTTDTKVQSAKLDALSASVETDANTSALFDPTKSDKLKANVQAHGLEVNGVEQGQEGQPGHMKLDKASIGSISAGYDKSDGGKASLEMQGAKLENFEMQSTKVATLEARMGELLAKKDQLTTDEKSELDKLKVDYKKYTDLKAKYATAKGSQKKTLEKQLAEWEKLSVTAVKKADVNKLTASATNLGDVTKGAPDMGKVGVGLDVDKASVEGLQAGDTKLKKGSIEGLSVTGANLTDEKTRTATVGVKSLEAEGLRMPGTAVGKAKVKGIDAKLDGGSLDAKVKTANVSGVYAGGSSVGYANASGIGYSMRNMGTDKETTNTSVAYFNAGGISTGTKDNLTTIDKVKGSGLSMASGKGYKGGGGSGIKLANVDATGITNTTVDKEGTKSVATIGNANASGVGVNTGKKGTSVSVNEANVSGVSYNTTGADGVKKSSIGLESAQVKGVGVNMDAKGGISANVKEASGKGLSYSDTKPVEKDGQTLNELQTTTANVGEFKAGDIGFQKNGDIVNAQLGSAEATGVKYGSKTTTGDGKTVLDESSAKVDKVGFNGVTANADLNGGGFDATVQGMNASGIEYNDKKRDGSSTQAKVQSVGVNDVVAGGNFKEGEYRGNVGNVDVKGIEYNGVDAKGVKSKATVESVKGTDLAGQANTKTGEYGGGFKQLQANEVDYQTGEKGKDGYMKVQTDKLVAGDGKSYSEVIYKDGKVNGSLKALELGPNTDKSGNVGNVFEMSKKDEKTGQVGNTSLKLGDEKGNAGKFTIGEVRMKDFNPSDLGDKNSSLQVFDIGADKFVLNTDTNVVVGDGVKLDALFMKGQGDGKVQAGYSGLGINSIDVDNKNADGTRSDLASVKDVKSSGGYAVMTGFKEGQDFGVEYAKIKDLSAGEIKVEYKIPPPTYEGDMEKYKKEMEAYNARGKYDPNNKGLDLSGLGNMDGNVKAKYTYNKDDDTFWDSVGAAFTGRSASADIDIKNGGVDLSSSNVKADGLSVGGVLANGIVGPLNGAVNLGAGVDGLVRDGGGTVSIPGMANGPTSEKDFNKAPERPDRDKYDADGKLKKDDGQGSLDRIDIDANLRNVGGGNIGYGETFQGQMNKGGSVQAKGNVGTNLDVNAQNIGFQDISAMGGDVKIGSAGVKDAQVKITNLADPEKGQVNVTVKDTKVTDVQYGKGGDTKGADADFDKMTKK